MVRERVSTTRRDRGSGSLYYDGDKQRWVGQLDLGTDATGRRIRPRVFGQTRAEVRARMEQLRSAHGTGQDVTVRATTFAELAELWLARGLSHDLSDNTIANYQSLLRRHILPAIGHRRVVDLRPEDVERLLDAMALQGYSARSLRLTHAVVRRILRLGERRGVVVRNVAAVVETPSGPTSLRKGLTPDQARSLLEASDDDRLGGLITVSLLLGLRPGEASGLTWSSIDLDAEPPTLTVARSLRRDSGRLVLVAPKTPSSHRTLALPRACAEALARQRDIQAQDHRVAGRRWQNDLGLVFTNETGGPLDPSNIRRSLKRIATSAGLDHIHPHLLRHAAASLMSEAGVPLEQISDTLGHRSVTVTAEIYRHPIAPVRSGHLAAMNQLLDRAHAHNNRPEQPAVLADAGRAAPQGRAPSDAPPPRSQPPAQAMKPGRVAR